MATMRMCGVWLFISLSVISCSKKEPAEGVKVSEAIATETSLSSSVTATTQHDVFDLNQLPQVALEQAKFPYYSLPEGYKPSSEEQNELKKYYVAIHGQLQEVKGQFYRSAISAEGAKSFSNELIVQSFVQNMQELGASQLNDQEIPYKLYEAHQDYSEHAEANIGQKTYTYGFKNQQGNPVLIQLTLNSPVIVVIELKPVKVKMKAVQSAVNTASAMAENITELGKAVVHINFAVDQAKIESSSQAVIEQIVQLLRHDTQLKLSIEGHTDDSGKAEHNQKLSQQRAEAVRQALIAKGIEESRLRSQGFGATQPVADNTSEAGKADNRRVELVKIS
ncbi:OmpA family protein [Acinetobacter rudis]|uniref:OmpA family protein n=1 Tax=Acinetobacter rudis TaxID=632955 RepID=UPI00280C4517|nr:OmpA family protein [Acinetobacter rudis]MDQ8953241.1 OmpA family protein [Acinetobacter rudis]